ncbi:MAG TPA: hypothetical protein VIL86_17605, partial [Tepidisphaeraceae bacterium]
SMALGHVGGALAGIGRFVTGAIATVGRLVVGGLRGVFNFLISIPGHIANAWRKLVSIGSSVIGVGERIFHLFRTAAISLLGAATALSYGAYKASKAAADYGRSIADVRNSTGYSATRSAGLLGRFESLGISRDAAGGMLAAQSPFVSNMKARALGLPGMSDPRFAEAIAGRYQSLSGQGAFGQMMARRQLDMMGMDTPEGRRVAMTPVSQIRAQQGYQQQVTGGMGLNPALLVAAGRQFDLLTARVKIFAGTALALIGQQMLPRINAELTLVTNYLAQHSKQIGDLIVNGVRAAWDAFSKFGVWLYAELPPMVLAASIAVLGFIKAILDATPMIWTGILRGIDMVAMLIGKAFDWIAPKVMFGLNLLANAGPLLQQLGQAFMATIGVIGQAITGLLTRIEQNPFVQRVIAALPAVAGVAGTVAGVTGAIGGNVQHTAQGMGISPAMAALLGLVVPGMLLRHGAGALASGALAAGRAGIGAIGGLFGGGGAVAGAGTAATGGSGIWGTITGAAGTIASIPAGILAAVATGGVALGTAGYGLIQQTGVMGAAHGKIGDAISNTYKRIANLATGQDYNANVSQMAYVPPAAAAAPGTPPAPGSVAAIQAQLATVWGNWGTSVKNAGNGNSIGVSNAMSGDQTWAGGIGKQVMSYLNTAPQSGVSKYLNDRFDVRGGSHSASDILGNTIAGLKRDQEKAGTAEQRRAEAEKLLAAVNTVAANTSQTADRTQRVVDAMNPMARSIITETLAVSARDAVMENFRA